MCALWSLSSITLSIPIRAHHLIKRAFLLWVAHTSSSSSFEINRDTRTFLSWCQAVKWGTDVMIIMIVIFVYYPMCHSIKPPRLMCHLLAVLWYPRSAADKRTTYDPSDLHREDAPLYLFIQFAPSKYRLPNACNSEWVAATASDDLEFLWFAPSSIDTDNLRLSMCTLDDRPFRTWGGFSGRLISLAAAAPSIRLTGCGGVYRCPWERGRTDVQTREL